MKIPWSKFKTFLYKYRWAFVSLAVLFGIFVLYDVGHAASLNPLTWWGSIKGAAIDTARGMLGALISVFAMIFYYAILTPVFWLIVVVTWILVEVASFQYFINVPAVVSGWVIMRDLVNMGFVVYLLYLAFASILSLASVNLEKSLIQLVLSVVLVNFSRMIVGLFIDLSQIVMLTFVNGFRNIAGGNIINKLQLDYFFKSVTITSDPTKAGPMFIKVALGIVMGIFILSILATMVTYLIIRVVKLWVLIIFSPLMALASLPGFSKYLGTFVSQWKKEFSNALMGGPFMAFSLWFSLMIISSTGEASAITTPSGAMADKLTGENVNLLSNKIFTMIVGASLLKASFDASLKMAGGWAETVGNWTYDQSKKYAGWVDKKVGAVTTRATGVDISIGGVKKGLTTGWDDIVAKDTEFNKGMREKGKAKREKFAAEGFKVPFTKDFRVFGVKSSMPWSKYTRSKKAEDKLGLPAITTEFDKAQKEKESHDDHYKLSQKHLKGYFDTVDNAATEMGGDAGKISKDNLDSLLKSGLISKDDSKALAIGKGRWNKKENKYDPLSVSEQEKYDAAKNKMDKYHDKYVDIKRNFESGDNTKVQSALDNLQKSGVINESQNKASYAEKSGAAQAQADKYSRLKKNFESVSKQAKKFSDERSQIVKKKLLKVKTSLSSRVINKDLEKDQKELNSYYDTKYNFVESPDEIANVLQQGGLNDEAFYYMLRKSGSDMSEVLRHMDLPESMDGIKIAVAEHMVGKSSQYAGGLQNMRDGKASAAEDDSITSLINDNLTQVAVETFQQVGRKNQGDNASLHLITSREPDGRDQILTKRVHDEFLNQSHRNGDLSTKSMARTFTKKDESGSEKLTKTGVHYLIQYSKKIEKDPYSADLPLAVWDAIENDRTQVEKIIEDLYSRGNMTLVKKKEVYAALDAIASSEAGSKTRLQSAIDTYIT